MGCTVHGVSKNQTLLSDFHCQGSYSGLLSLHYNKPVIKHSISENDFRYRIFGIVNKLLTQESNNWGSRKEIKLKWVGL